MSIQSNIALTIQNRKAFKKILDSQSIDQINQIPNGFNNNIFWNCAHVLAVQQMLTYRLIGNDIPIPELVFSNFIPGTKPTRKYTNEDVIDLKSTLFSSIEQLKSDIDSGLFGKPFRPFMTALKFEVKDIDSALLFNLYHEALHMGHILNLMKFT